MLPTARDGFRMVLLYKEDRSYRTVLSEVKIQVPAVLLESSLWGNKFLRGRSSHEHGNMEAGGCIPAIHYGVV